MLKYFKFHFLFRVFLNDSFLLKPLASLMTLHNLLLMSGKFRKHFLILTFHLFGFGCFGDRFLAHFIIIIKEGNIDMKAELIEIYV